MIALNDWSLPMALAAPAILNALARLLRGRNAAEALRLLRDTLTLRMVLREADPAQRAQLLDAHRAWRSEPPISSTRVPRPRR